MEATNRNQERRSDIYNFNQQQNCKILNKIRI